MTEHLTDVKALTQEQSDRAIVLSDQMRADYWGLYSCARVIVHLQDRVAELERLLNKAEIERAWAIGKLREAMPTVGARQQVPVVPPSSIFKCAYCEAPFATAVETDAHIVTCKVRISKPTVEGALRELRQRLGLTETTGDAPK